MLDFNLNPELSFHYHSESDNNPNLPPVEHIIGTGVGWTKEIHGSLTIKAVQGRTTLHIRGPGALKIVGHETIG